MIKPPPRDSDVIDLGGSYPPEKPFPAFLGGEGGR